MSELTYQPTASLLSTMHGVAMTGHWKNQKGFQVISQKILGKDNLSTILLKVWHMLKWR